MNSQVKRIISSLELSPHPEGGYYREVYRSTETMPCPWAPDEERNLATSIYFLLIEENFSAFHHIRSDEGWHFYEGAPVEIWVVEPNGKATCNVISSENRQFIVPAGHWFASRTLGTYALTGCTVSPGFDFRDFDLAERQALTREFPFHKELIHKFTRE
jgi:predicted cupin superfamily sugar epimerase